MKNRLRLILSVRAPKELYTMIMECLESMEKKVDAAFGMLHIHNVSKHQKGD
jgi:hypothetical protein